MSEEIALADATLAEIARLTITITGLRATITQQKREIEAERRARELAQAENAYLREWLIGACMIRNSDIDDALMARRGT